MDEKWNGEKSSGKCSFFTRFKREMDNALKYKVTLKMMR